MEGGLLFSSVKILRSLPCIAGLYNGVYTCPPIRGYLLLYHPSGSTHDDGRHESEKTNFSFSPPEEGCIHPTWQSGPNGIKNFQSRDFRDGIL